MTTYKSISDMLRSIGVSEDSIAEVERKGTEKAVETLAKMVKRLEEEKEEAECYCAFITSKVIDDASEYEEYYRECKRLREEFRREYLK